MLQQLTIKFKESFCGYDEYFLFYDDAYMTQEDAEKELEFLGVGSGYNPANYPYYLILPKSKKPILSSIKVYLTSEQLNGAQGK